MREATVTGPQSPLAVWKLKNWAASKVGGVLHPQMHRSCSSAKLMPFQVSGSRGPWQRMTPCDRHAGQ